VLAATLAATPARPVRAQGSVLERLNIDKLQLAALGASLGSIRPSQADATTIFAVSADYGEIAREWRVVFGLSYWGSHYTDAVVRGFADSLKKSLVDPTGTARIAASPISLYDVTFNMEFRWMYAYSGEIKPFLGVGVAAHVIDAEGALIKGTFVERALDNIAAGLFATAGGQLRLVRHFGVEGAVRGDLLSGFRSLQARAGGNYYFGHLRGRSP
jgi:hypothetical protein